MNYHNITKDDMKNGDGLRVVLWVAGCDHHCEGCQNPVTWDPSDGVEWNWSRDLYEIQTELQKDYVSGLTLSGGDPFYKDNITTVLGICRWAKEHFPSKTVWVYTGYRWEYLHQAINFPESIWQYIDVLVDGPFVQEKLDVNYPWAGSTNQRVIDVQASVREGKVVLHESH